MKKIKSTVIILAVLALFFTPCAFATSGGGGGSGGGDNTEIGIEVGSENNNSNQQGQSQGQTAIGIGGSNELTIQDAFTYEVNNVSKDNVSIGGWLHASGMSPGLPDIPLHWKLAIEQYNEATPAEIFNSMPEIITREHIAVYKETTKEEMGSWDRGKLKRNLNKRSFTWAKFPATDELRVLSGYPNAIDPKTGKPIAEKGKAYKTICRLVFNAEHEVVYREDLAMHLTEWGMDKGANALIVSGFGTRRVFDTKTNALSLLSAFGQVFTSGWTGAMNISPGMAHQGGSNQTETLPYLRVTAVRVLDARAFVAGLLPQKYYDDAAKVQVDEGSSDDSSTELDQLRNKIKEQGSGLVSCPDPGANNAELRYNVGMDYIRLFVLTNDEAEAASALDNARQNLAQSLRDDPNGKRAKEIHEKLASIWFAMGASQKDPEPYHNKAVFHAQKAGISEFKELK